MVQFLKRKPKEDAARQRYPEALWPLLSLGKGEQEADYSQFAEALAGHVPDLIRMALDEDLNYREEDDPAVWAPLHALSVLRELGPIEAAEPLTECLAWGDEWYNEVLPKVYASIGPASVPILQAYLENPDRDVWGRIYAAKALATIAETYPEERASLVRYLIDYLDRPTAGDNPDEESVTTFVISDLADLEAREAYPAIKRAYDQDRVDLQVIGLEDVEVDFGMRPRPDYSRLEPPKEAGVRLELKCKACGRERSYLFPKVYYDLGTAKNKKKSAKYDPLVIPQPVVCSKCGAVDQYELAGMGYLALTADLLTHISSEMKDLRREDQRVQYMEFEAMGRKMHPLEAIERYQEEIARHPNDSRLYVGYGNVLRFLGRFEGARAQYQRALELDPLNLHAYADRANLALRQGNKTEALSNWERMLELAPRSQVSDQERELFIEAAGEAITLIRKGREHELLVEPGLESSPARVAPLRDRGRGTGKKVTAPLSRKAEPVKPVASKKEVNRNDPCPCGSGKKYKHCCMRKRK